MIPYRRFRNVPLHHPVTDQELLNRLDGEEEVELLSG